MTITMVDSESNESALQAAAADPEVKKAMMSWNRIPLEVWANIFFLTAGAQIPRYTALKEDEIPDADCCFNTELHMRLGDHAKTETIIRNTMFQRLRLAQVCKEWRTQNICKVFERIHMDNMKQFAPLAEVLKHSKTLVSCPGGYGAWTKEFSWRLPPVKGGQYPAAVAESMAEVVRYLSNLAVFRPSPNVGCTNMPTVVMTALMERENIQSLRDLCILGQLDLADLYEMFCKPEGCKSVTTVSLGATWNAYGPQVGFDLPELRSLHVDMDQYNSYIQQFIRGDLPKLEQLFIMFRRPHQRHTNNLFTAHGKTLNFIWMQMTKGFHAPAGTESPNLRTILQACPNVTDILYDLLYFQEWDDFHGASDTPSQLRRVGVFTTNINCKWLLDNMRIRFGRLRSAKLPKSLKVVRMMNISAPSLKMVEDKEFGNLLQYFIAWSDEWKKKGVRLEDSRGKTFSSWDRE